MIGLIGPADSVALALRVAQDGGLGAQVITRTYSSIDEAPALARELDGVCGVVVFTGRVPYALTSRRGEVRAALQYVPHSGADLYGSIVRLLRERGCRMPPVSIDTIEPDLVTEAFEDLDLDVPRRVMPLDVERDDSGALTAAGLVAFHRGLVQAGDVEVCLTCVGSVADELRAAGIDVIRITHTRSVLRDALRQAHLTERLAITESTQPAAVLVALPSYQADGPDDPGPYEAQRRRLRAREGVLDVAERLQGRLADVDDRTSMVYTSRGTIESALARYVAGHDGPLSGDGLPSGVRLGIGLGRTVAAAEEHARRALRMGERDHALHIGFPDGDVLRVTRGGPATTYRLRETQPGALRVAQELGIGPLAFARLTRALQQVDASAVTAAELAHAYGIETRSARRLITALQKAGIASRLGSQAGPGAGRPQTVYRIDLERLVGDTGLRA